ncbi:U-scoloptoxin(16)-Ssd1a-like [Drosophila innubila]|uniref:U-scoloptoxin(16)-Ssd1a-like n=1 Tax=Drosophila innubila TaxID=198719 RepID=UPI00148BF99C|nr:U-scoloptoxin(16)-Ssd1a-like [Drosophila innubila]
MLRDKMNLFMNGILLLLAALLLPHSEAALARGIFKDPAHPGKCVVKPNLILSSGQSARYPDMDCARIMCEQDSHATISTCGVEAAPPGCRMSQPKYPNADYPKCCKRNIVCGK